MGISSEAFLNAFNIDKKIGNEYYAHCPAHEDEHASLHILVKQDGTRLVNCKCGCNTSDILAAVGFNTSDLYADSGTNDSSTATKPSWKSKYEYGLSKSHGQGVHIVDEYKYLDESGKYLYSKLRIEGGNLSEKMITFAVVDEENDSYVSGSKNIEQTLFRLPEVISAVKDGKTIYITEGEKDVLTLEKHGYVATTSGSAGSWKDEFAEYFMGAEVVILPDKDKSGQKYANTIKNSLKNYAFAVKIVTVGENDKEDITDYLNNGHSIDDFRKLRDEVSFDYAYWVKTDFNAKDRKYIPKGINPDFLADVTAKMNHYLIVRNPLDKEDVIYLYQDGKYEIANKPKMKAILKKRIKKGFAADSVINSALNLLMCSDEAKVIDFDELDKSEQYINFKNGLLNLNTWKLEPHTPNVWSTIQIQVEYNPDEFICPVFCGFMDDFCRDENGIVDEKVKDILLEYMGLTISNIYGYRVKKSLFLFGAGNAGKSQLLGLLELLLGKNKCANIAIQDMNDKNRFIFSTILGKRVISNGDQKSETIDDSSYFKSLSGGDEIRVEPKGKTAFNMKFRGTMIFAGNDMPTFKNDKGDYIFRRIMLHAISHSIKAEDVDPHILDKMWEERVAIVNMLLFGLKRLIDNNYVFSESERCQAALLDYRNKIDTVYRFISENGYELTNNAHDIVSKPDFENNYLNWLARNEIQGVAKHNIADRMAKFGCTKAKTAGLEVYRFIKNTSV